MVTDQMKPSETGKRERSRVVRDTSCHAFATSALGTKGKDPRDEGDEKLDGINASAWRKTLLGMLSAIVFVLNMATSNHI